MPLMWGGTAPKRRSLPANLLLVLSATSLLSTTCPNPASPCPMARPDWAKKTVSLLPLLPEWANVPSFAGAGAATPPPLRVDAPLPKEVWKEDEVDGGGNGKGEDGVGKEVTSGREFRLKSSQGEDMGPGEEEQGEAEAMDVDSKGGGVKAAVSKENDDWVGLLPPNKVLKEVGKMYDVDKEERLRAGKFDQWSKRVWEIADDYDIKGLEDALWQRRKELDIPPGKPLWVQLPLGGDNWIDASRLTTGTVIEAILTNGKMLDRDAEGRVIVDEDLDPELARAEPLRSLFRHRLVMGVDEWDESDDGDEGRVRYDIADVGNEMLGPYKDSFDRFLEGNYSEWDMQRLVEMRELVHQTRIDDARGQAKADALLWNAIRKGDEEQADLLVRKEGSSLTAVDEEQDGLAALHKAVNNGDLSMAKLLLSLGSPVDQKDADEMSPLHLASSRGDEAMASLLLESGADVAAVDANRWTPLHHVAATDVCQDLGPITRRLMAAGADLATRDIRGRTARELASGIGRKCMEQYLLALEKGEGVELTELGFDDSQLPYPKGDFQEGFQLPSDEEDVDSDAPQRPRCDPLEALRTYRRGKGILPKEAAKGEDGNLAAGEQSFKRQFETYRRYDGTDHADTTTAEDLEQVMDMITTWPGAVLTPKQFKGLVDEGVLKVNAPTEEEHDERAKAIRAVQKEYKRYAPKGFLESSSSSEESEDSVSTALSSHAGTENSASRYTPGGDRPLHGQ